MSYCFTGYWIQLPLNLLYSSNSDLTRFFSNSKIPSGNYLDQFSRKNHFCAVEHYISSTLCYSTWFRGVRLSPFGTEAVFPAYRGVLDEASDMAEQLAEAHVGCVVHGVVEESGAPQEGLLPQQHAVNAGQSLLCRIGWLQSKLLPSDGSCPRLHAVVHAA